MVDKNLFFRLPRTCLTRKLFEAGGAMQKLPLNRRWSWKKVTTFWKISILRNFNQMGNMGIPAQLKDDIFSFFFKSQLTALVSVFPHWQQQKQKRSTFIWLYLNISEELLAPTGALIAMMVYYISAAAAAATFSDFHSVHQCNWC